MSRGVNDIFNLLVEGDFSSYSQIFTNNFTTTQGVDPDIWAISIDEKNELVYIADRNNDALSKIELDGTQFANLTSVATSTFITNDGSSQPVEWAKTPKGLYLVLRDDFNNSMVFCKAGTIISRLSISTLLASGFPNSVAISSDGKFVVVAGKDVTDPPKTLRIIIYQGNI